jgi:CRISPR/Cas system CSM-associated protein Csm3 (group 7 of RAMP superfamily)
VPFKSRWSIEGTLVTQTPLHIGGGEVDKRGVWDGRGMREIEVATLAMDHRSRPYLPGSSLKGVVRAWLKGRGLGADLVGDLFGSIAAGGKAEFWDAPLHEDLEPAHPPPLWQAPHQFGTEVGVAIDRLTRAASDRKLFHRDLVPTGATFNVTITGLDLTDAEVTLLLAGLAGFNWGPSRIRLGADGMSGKGECVWTPNRIRRMVPEDLDAWLKRSPLCPAHQYLPDLSRNRRRKLEQAAAELIDSVSAPSVLRVGLRLLFDSPFLVNDPVGADEATADHRPRRDNNGKVYLPASSFRGAVRSQAERILRTMGLHACRTDDPRDACPPLRDAKERREKLCNACQVFGGAGWRSPVGISDFALVADSGRKLPEEFVAIDRFTGGGAEHQKFNAESRYAPILSGTVEIDLERTEHWGLGLLALTLNDLSEGDITFGLGAAKGHGSCRAQVTEWSLSSSDGSGQAMHTAGEGPPTLDKTQRDQIFATIQALRDLMPTRSLDEAAHGE